MEGRRSAVLIGLTVVTVGAVVALVVMLTHRSGSDTGDGRPPPPSSGASQRVAVGAAYPMSYVIVYRVTRNGVQQWEVLTIQRPFGGSDVTYTTTGEPRTGDHASSGSLSTTTNLYSVSANGVQLVSGRQPGPPAGDEYIGAETAELARRGLATDLGTSTTIAGRACETYRFAGPPSGAVVPLATGGDHDDLCLDADALVLSETWSYHGRTVLQRVAVEVHASSAAVVDAGSLPPPPSTAGAIAPGPYAATLTPSARPVTAIATPVAPAGFQPYGPAVSFRLPDPNAPSQTAAVSVVWAFTKGPRVITVEAGSQQGGGPPWREGDTATESVSLAGLGPASTAVRSDGFEVRVDLGDGSWVRIRGTVALDELVAFAQRLTRRSS